jgi:hypothetical protein
MDGADRYDFSRFTGDKIELAQHFDEPGFYFDARIFYVLHSGRWRHIIVVRVDEEEMPCWLPASYADKNSSLIY